ncbi:VanZ family protein [Permianibacter sp. IMCC34836]|uniref:VanZ family protein n=1 Tax=Permianibacter fluminis TaxID=2738515 RepID=UPI0015551350|nr:VanZ family protein [Permianibacter fluminis]NQD37088.1 VanZ family protein [Permianibacter fluminis]
MLHARRHRLTLLVASLLVALYLLLVQDKIALPNRAAAALWDLAHLPLFFLLTVIFDHSVLKRHPRRAAVWLQLLLPPLVVFAIGTELLQSLTNREPSLGDVITDSVGIGLATLWLASSRYVGAGWKKMLRGIVFAIAASLLIQPGVLLWADYHIKHNFPMLSDFESIIDSSNWSLGKRSAEQARDGRHSLKIVFPTQLYSGTTLRHFPTDWSAYKTLHLSVFNPGNDTLPLSLRIHDRKHELGEQPYHDRFNYNFAAGPGWTDVQLPINRIASGPRDRKLDLGQLAALRLFYQGLPADGTVVYLDAVYLD